MNIRQANKIVGKFRSTHRTATVQRAYAKRLSVLCRKHGVVKGFYLLNGFDAL